MFFFSTCLFRFTDTSHEHKAYTPKNLCPFLPRIFSLVGASESKIIEFPLPVFRARFPNCKARSSGLKRYHFRPPVNLFTRPLKKAHLPTACDTLAVEIEALN